MNLIIKLLNVKINFYKGRIRMLHSLNRHELEPTLGDNVGQGSLACCNPESQRVRHDLVLNNNKMHTTYSDADHNN